MFSTYSLEIIGAHLLKCVRCYLVNALKWTITKVQHYASTESTADATIPKQNNLKCAKKQIENIFNYLKICQILNFYLSKFQHNMII